MKIPIASGTTASVAFSAYTKNDLFSVVPGVSFGAALEEISLLLDIAKRVGERSAMDADGDSLMFASVHMIGMAKAVVDSISFDDSDGNSRDEAVLQRLHRLCDEGVLVVSPQAGKPAADDARQFLRWVAECAGGVSA